MDDDELDDIDRAELAKEMTRAYADSFNAALDLLDVVRMARAVADGQEDHETWGRAMDVLAETHEPRRVVQVVALALYELPDAEVIRLLGLGDTLVGLAELVVSGAAAEA